MKMPEHVQPCTAAAIVEVSLGQDTQQGRLANVETAEYGDSEIDVLLVIGDLYR